MREFTFRDESSEDNEAELWADYAETMRLRDSLAASLAEILPHIDRNWQRDLPYDLQSLEMLFYDPSLALSMR